MERYLDIAANAYSGYWNYLRNELLHPSWHNYLYWLIGLSLLVWSLEIVVPWRKQQRIVRRDFWLDGFYMFFNLFLFSLIVYNAVSEVAVTLFNDALGAVGVRNLVALHIGSWPAWAQLLFLFVVADFIQWNVHRLLHRVPWLWEFHKVHHSVKEMGFAAHLRFHWMEIVVYRTAQFIPLSMIGYGLDDLFIMHIVTTLIGHLNHSNINLGWGPLRYIINSPRMHIWHLTHVAQWALWRQLRPQPQRVGLPLRHGMVAQARARHRTRFSRRRALPKDLFATGALAVQEVGIRIRRRCM